ncbi:putative beta-lysine N-acetyltransferase [Halobacillus mangrovi]|uniref:Putative beta-lysine N-acetyltransferase n=1 Tax=Halobacillus mangrovi TaxID=402384 RepID=A0A1W5ZX91_9BACI|nr:putative beta-lysine N-acetyltransferase [Halobacillus mangrovi]ARI77899.1 putative beta-lysine N-acetyltransferase [Halobacillus mangrovi]
MGSNRFLSASALMEKDYFDVEPISRRIKVYELPENMNEERMKELHTAAAEMNCDKLIFYVKAQTDEEEILRELSAKLEGEIKGFFRGEDTKIYAKYLDPDRNQPDSKNVISRVRELDLTSHAMKEGLQEGYTMTWGKEDQAEEMAKFYKSIFSKYPTPIHEPDYIVKMLNDNVHFSLIYHDGKIVSACSADIFSDYGAAEFTDCATLPAYRGQGLLSHQYPFLQEKMKALGIKTMYSYTRAISMGMNIITAQQGFTYGGCMVQNSMIGTGLEDMNIWYKQL